MRCSPKTPLVALALLAWLLVGCPAMAPEGGQPDAGKAPKAAPVPPPIDPAQELMALNRQVESQLAPAVHPDPLQLQQLDQQLYDRARAMDQGHAEVQRAYRLRGEIKARLTPAFLAMAEASWKAGRYDDAIRQAGFVPDSAAAELVKRKKALLARVPEMLRRRDACAREHGMKACRIREEHSDWPMKICKGLTEEMVGLDMTPEMVRISWGAPKEVEQEAGEKKGELKVTWHYPNGAFVIFTGPSVDKLKVSEVQN